MEWKVGSKENRMERQNGNKTSEMEREAEHRKIMEQKHKKRNKRYNKAASPSIMNESKKAIFLLLLYTS